MRLSQSSLREKRRRSNAMYLAFVCALNSSVAFAQTDSPRFPPLPTLPASSPAAVSSQAAILPTYPFANSQKMDLDRSAGDVEMSAKLESKIVQLLGMKRNTSVSVEAPLPAVASLIATPVVVETEDASVTLKPAPSAPPLPMPTAFLPPSDETLLPQPIPTPAQTLAKLPKLPAFTEGDEQASEVATPGLSEVAISLPSADANSLADEELAAPRQPRIARQRQTIKLNIVASEETETVELQSKAPLLDPAVAASSEAVSAVAKASEESRENSLIPASANLPVESDDEISFSLSDGDSTHNISDAISTPPAPAPARSSSRRPQRAAIEVEDIGSSVSMHLSSDDETETLKVSSRKRAMAGGGVRVTPALEQPKYLPSLLEKESSSSRTPRIAARTGGTSLRLSDSSDATVTSVSSISADPRASGRLQQTLKQIPTPPPASTLLVENGGMSQRLMTTGAPVQLQVRQARVVRINKPISTISVENPNIARIVQSSGSSISIVGLQGGTTQLAIITEGTGEIEVRSINVEAPQANAELQQLARTVNATVRELYPQSNISISAGEDRLIVEGTTVLEKDAREIISFVRKTSLVPVTDELKSVER